MVPHNYKLEYSAQEIASGVAKVAADAQQWLQAFSAKHGSAPLVVPILRGGVFFFCDLARQIQCSVEMGYMRCKAYETEKFAEERPCLEFDLSSLDVKGRPILLVDDILDSGRSMSQLKDALLHAGAAGVKAAVLIRRRSSAANFTPDWFAFEYPGDEWLVGYGMDDRNSYCNLPDIYSIRK